MDKQVEEAVSTRLAADDVQPMQSPSPSAASDSREPPDLPAVPPPAAAIVEIDSTLLETLSVPAPSLSRGEVCKDLVVAPHHAFGMDVSTLQNLAYIAPGKALYAAGNTLMELDVHILTRTSVFSIGGGGVGCFAIHPSGKFLAVGERGGVPAESSGQVSAEGSEDNSCRIFVLEYPSFRVVKALSGGAERGYSCLDFNISGDKIASVSQLPDYMLTIWNWCDEAISLRCKAFGQDVYNVKFSPDDDGRLVTSGAGHIRFWRMASTFTGLKLQGEIGRFGKIELSDVAAFAILPDGKVLSGTECGDLLLWEGAFIKCRFVQSNADTCHTGAILSVTLDRPSGCFITAAVDGWLKWWPFAAVDAAEPNGAEHSLEVEIAPWKTLHCGVNVVPRCITRGGVRGTENDHFLLLDSAVTAGGLRMLSLDPAASAAEPLACFHSGAVTSVSVCPTSTSSLTSIASSYNCATSGSDGSVRTWNMTSKVPLEVAFFPSSGSATCVMWAPECIDAAGSIIAAGFTDGVVRILSRDPAKHRLRLVQALKPHTSAVTVLTYSPDGKWLATGGVDGTVFFIKTQVHDNTSGSSDSSPFMYTPAGYVCTPNGHTPTSLNWRADSNAIIAACGTEGVVEYDVTAGQLHTVTESSVTFELQGVPSRTYHLKRRPPPIEEIAVDADATDNSDSPTDPDVSKQSVGFDYKDPPAPALQAVYLDDEESFGLGRKFLATYGGWAKGTLFECHWNGDFPIAHLAGGGRCTDELQALEHEDAQVPSSICHVSVGGPRGTPFLLTGSMDGSVSVRPVLHRTGYVRVQCADVSTDVSAVGVSNDGCWLVSASVDGLLNVYRLRPDKLCADVADGVALASRKGVSLDVPPRLPLDHPAHPSNQLHSKTVAVNAAAATAGSSTAATAMSPQRSPKATRSPKRVKAEPAAAVTAVDSSTVTPEGETAINVTETIGASRTDVTVFATATALWWRVFNDGGVGVTPHLDQFDSPSAEGDSPPVATSEDTSAKAGAQLASFSAKYDKLKGAAGRKKAVGITPTAFTRTSVSKAAITEPAITEAAVTSPQPQTATLVETEIKEAADSSTSSSYSNDSVQRPSHASSTAAAAVVVSDSSGIHDSGFDDKDITAPTAYSIQEARLKTESDAAAADAEMKKDVARAAIVRMQSEFEALCEANAQLPHTIALSPQEMIVDPDYVAILQAKKEQALIEARLEVAYESEKAQLQLSKLKKRFVDDVEVERITLRALHWDYRVTSFKTGVLSEELKAQLDIIHKQIREEELEAAKVLNSSLSGSLLLTDDVSGNGSLGNGSHKGSRKNLTAKEAAEAAAKEAALVAQDKLSSFESRRRKRHDRATALQTLMNAKPASDADDIRDVKAISHAEATVGDFRLKCSPYYQVPSTVQLNVQRKHRELALLQESMHTLKMKFNERFLTLRGLKRDIVDGICTDGKRIREIDEFLGLPPSEDLWEPSLDRSEWPELRDCATEQELTEFKALRDKLYAAAATGGSSKAGSSASHVSLSSDLPQPPGAAATLAQVKQLSASADATVTSTSDTPMLKSADEYESIEEYEHACEVAAAAVVRNAAAVISNLPSVKGTLITAEGKPSALEEEEHTGKIMLLQEERRMLLIKTAENVLAFDEAVYDLRRERMLVTADLQAAELDLLLLRQELEVLLAFDGRDTALSQKLDKARTDKAGVTAAISDCNKGLTAKRAELEVWQQKEGAILQEFMTLAPLNHPYHIPLIKVFKRRVKRSRKNRDQSGAPGSNDDANINPDESSDQEDSEDEDFDDDVSDDASDASGAANNASAAAVDDSCAPGCDIALHEQVLELREKRLDQEDGLIDIQKMIDELKRTMDRQVTRQRQIDKDLTQTEAEITAFQLEKQRKLNELDVVVSLKLNQLHCMDNTALSTPIQDTAVTTDAAVTNSGVTVPQLPTATSAPSATVYSSDSKLVASCGMGSHTLFTKQGLDRLDRRTAELIDETQAERERFKELHRERSRLEKARSEKEAEREIKAARCNELQLLKFGQMIDLELLDRVSAGMTEDEIHAKVSGIEASHHDEITQLSATATKLKGALLRSTGDNTALLQKVAHLSSRQFQLEKELNNRGGKHGGSSVAVGDKGPSVRLEVEERERLMALVKLQAKELDAIKSEINLLRRKGGHMYSQVQQVEAPPRVPTIDQLPPIGVTASGSRPATADDMML